MSIFLVSYFFIATGLSLAINYLLLKFSFNLGTRNNLAFKQVRWTAHVKPSIGGVSFFIIFLLSWGIMVLFPWKSIALISKLSGSWQLQVLFPAGLYDDAFNTNFAQIYTSAFCGIILISFNVKISISNLSLSISFLRWFG
jgi:hypothetical protein